MNMSPKDQTFYEIIRSGSPSRLYFDLEYDKTVNQTADPIKIMDVFREKLVLHIKKILGIDLATCFPNRNIREFFIEVDSSNNKKFSRHVIVPLPGESFFANNLQIGKFVSNFCKQLLTEAAFSEQFQNVSENVKNVRRLFLKKKQKEKIEKHQIFIDTHVYTKNRHFRILLSAKFKDIYKRHFQYVRNNDLILNERRITLNLFQKTLCTYTGEIQKEMVMTLRWGLLNSTFPKVQICQKRIINKPQHVVKPFLENKRFEKLVHYFNMTVLPSWRKYIHTNFKIKSFVRVIYYKNSERLVLKVFGTKFCLNVMRQHKSNNIYFVVNIEQFNFSQRCHDQLCCNFQSPFFDLDPALLFS